MYGKCRSKDEFFMTLMKLRSGLLFADHFGGLCSQFFSSSAWGKR